MDAGRANLFVIMLAGLAALCLTPSVCAKPTERAALLRSCERLFGPTVDAGQNLFEVNQAFVLEVRFTKRGRLAELAIWPKYTFNVTHPEWVEPDSIPYLSKAEHKDLLARLDAVKPRGRLITPRSHIFVVMNSRALHREVYEHALLEWDELLDGRGISSFKLSYAKRR